MKPVFRLTTMSWYVNGLGFFKTKEEALRAIEDNKLKYTVKIRISNKTRKQLQKLSEDRCENISEVIRKLIDKETTV